MHNWNNNYNRGFEGGHVLMMLTMLAFWGLVIWGVVLLYRRNASHIAMAVPSAQSAQNILNERLATGEISEDEFKSRSEALKVVHTKTVK
jgi:putative membrane protein